MQKHIEQIDRKTGKSCKAVWCTYPTGQNLQRDGLWHSKTRLSRSPKTKT